METLIKIAALAAMCSILVEGKIGYSDMLKRLQLLRGQYEALERANVRGNSEAEGRKMKDKAYLLDEARAPYYSSPDFSGNSFLKKLPENDRKVNKETKAADIADENYVCYSWTAEDVAAMGSGKGNPEVEVKQCESYPGNVFTQGNNLQYPNCGGCWCCKPKTDENYVCYTWTAEDVAAMGSGAGNPEVEVKQCESYPGNVFTQGNNLQYPNCGGCWCCKPKTDENYVCYDWTAEDVDAMGSGKGNPEVEVKQCESYPGNVFTQGNNLQYPNCGGCWCCKPKTDENYVCYDWTAEDVDAMGSGKGNPEVEVKQCESYPGNVFTQGNNLQYPNCGGCWCCKPKTDENYVCYDWTAEDVDAMGSGKGNPEVEVKQCESYPGNVFTQGNNLQYPNCGGCWCCRPKNRIGGDVNVVRRKLEEELLVEELYEMIKKGK